ncbi:peroxidase-like isoform X2 [Zootermopsis nevadensis]|nr:peroxidase-like isoform X2 [Zootermopsis nevadensis]XP_021919998.1 peroxidase-like isoform X2 [Zootermopsis nevadensis]XP_021920006.1 peroxidase-like isoform X2 [Zootermopsis nevadensis]XP_021920015.1 peroxidase-like isoform X2 [Zootermopsis nevadensis]
MACGSVVLAFLLWTSLQFGVKFSLTSPTNIQALNIPALSRTYNSYKTFASWPILYQQRSERSIQKATKLSGLPHVDDESINLSVKFSESNLGRETRMENNLIRSNTKVRQETPQHGQLIESYPSAEALRHGKNGLIATKASLYISHKHCQWYGVDDDECGAFVMSMEMNTTSLGDKCAAQYSSSASCSGKYRSIDGSCNHENHKAWGKVHTSYLRLLEPQYGDGIQEPRKPVRGKSLPSARLISTGMTKESDSEDTSKTLSLVQWTEFIEHDLVFTPATRMVHSGNPIMCCRQDGSFLAPRYIHPACMPISVPNNDPFYSKYRQRCMNYVRSLMAMRPDCHFGPAEQMNQATHHLDGSMIYGSTVEKAWALRTFANGGLSAELKNGREYLPRADKPLQQCQVSSNTSSCYKAGDLRVNLHPHLAIMHTLWLREHNRIVEKLALLNPHWDDDTLYQEARKIVIAEIQHITYDEWLPLVLGSRYTKKLGLRLRKTGFSSDFTESLNPSVSNSFATAGIRFRLSMMVGNIGLYDENRNTNKSLQLRNNFNHPEAIEESENLDSLVRGLATQTSQKSDLYYENDLIQMLYKDDGRFGMDALSLDVQRGRDHGLPGYNHYRKLCGLPPGRSFDGFLDVMSKSTVAKLKSLYAHPDDVDLLVGAMSEHVTDDSVLGFTFRCIIGEQMLRTKKGDRFFYDVPSQENSFTEAQLDEIRKSTLARVFCDNADDIKMMQPNVFVRPSKSNQLVSCSSTDDIKQPSLSPWKEFLVKSS